jgi:iron complex outermembrane receptor protein
MKPSISTRLVQFPFCCLSLFLILNLIFVSDAVFGQTDDSLLSPAILKRMSLEDLMNLQVTSVTKTPQKLSEVASAIQVITGEDIQRSSATSLPEALRLASNLQVAQTNSHDWAITARGFNGAPLSNASLADKLLVMIDGRSVYNPLFGGVFWDAQNVLLEDIDRIEVVSGPGGTLWGDNAVNGVINVTSKTADKTQGLYASAAVGTFLQDQAGARFGGKAGKNIFYRVYGQFSNDKSTTIHDTTNSKDNWNMVQGGFRMDYFVSEKNTITFQGDLYSGNENSPTSTIINGQNILGRWTHKFSESSDLKLQVYFDRTYRDLSRIAFTDEVKTYDLDLQHSFLLGKRQQIVWGGSFRSAEDNTKSSPAIFFTPANTDLILGTGFVQDQISILKDRLQLTLGTKLSGNHYTGFEYQPSGRLAFTPDTHHTIWAAVSRAVRVPSRFDADESLPSLTTPKGKFSSEKVLAYELGYRLEPVRRIAVSLAGFYNWYTDLRRINVNPNGPATTLIFSNDQKAHTWGIEVSASYLMFDWWHFRMGYTYLGKKFTALSPAVLKGADIFEGLDPHHQAMLQSVVDLPKNIQFDVNARFVDSLTIWPLTPDVSQYFSLDLRIGWQYKKFEFSIVGKNLLAARHVEFVESQIPRSIYGKIVCRF